MISSPGCQGHTFHTSITNWGPYASWLLVLLLWVVDNRLLFIDSERNHRARSYSCSSNRLCCDINFARTHFLTCMALDHPLSSKLALFTYSTDRRFYEYLTDFVRKPFISLPVNSRSSHNSFYLPYLFHDGLLQPKRLIFWDKCEDLHYSSLTFIKRCPFSHSDLAELTVGWQCHWFKKSYSYFWVNVAEIKLLKVIYKCLVW